jgi:hypothetical protein
MIDHAQIAAMSGAAVHQPTEGLIMDKPPQKVFTQLLISKQAKNSQMGGSFYANSERRR